MYAARQPDLDRQVALKELKHRRGRSVHRWHDAGHGRHAAAEGFGATLLSAPEGAAVKLGSVDLSPLSEPAAGWRRDAGSANHPSEQAAAARRLAVAHGTAATAASRLAPGPIGADSDAAIVASLRNLSAAYTSLARAADRADKQGYAAASTAITQADAALAAGFARLREDGFTVG